jgi:beta-phosphoglucomutase
MRRFDAVLFDLDGTLVDNMPIHVQAWQRVLARHGASVTEEELLGHAGLRNEEIIPLLMKRPVTVEELAALAREKEAEYRARYRGKVRPVAGLRALLQRLADAQVPCALATGAPAENRQLVLEELGMTAAFVHIVGPEHVAHGKPDPDLFLTAAEALHVSATACLVFEDAQNGIRAARTAGMTAVGVTTRVSGAKLRAAGAQWTVPDFQQLPDDLEEQLVGGAP